MDYIEDSTPKVVSGYNIVKYLQEIKRRRKRNILTIMFNRRKSIGRQTNIRKVQR